MKVKKSRVAILIAAVVVIIATVVFLWNQLKGDDATIEFKDIETFEYGDESVTGKSLVESCDGIIVTYPDIDVHKIGEQELVYIVEKGNDVTQVIHTVEIRDTKKPSIKLAAEKVELKTGDTFDPNANIKSITDPVDGALSVSKTLKKGTYTLTDNVNVKKAGTYKAEIFAMDINANKHKATYDVIVKKADTTATGEPAEIQPTYINGILLVNKTHGLPRDFGDTDPVAFAKLTKLQEAANAAGYDMPMLSGYRSYAYQVDLYNAYVARDGKEAADRYSARPGYSEHQSGLCFDIGNIDDNYGDTEAGKWLQEHCKDYGFIIRYPKGKEDVTGYQYEPWHVRYVGEAVAKDIMDKNSTLEEYLGAGS